MIQEIFEHFENAKFLVEIWVEAKYLSPLPLQHTLFTMNKSICYYVFGKFVLFLSLLSI